MTSVEYRPYGAVGRVNADTIPAVITGGESAWSDDSDATHAAFGQSVTVDSVFRNAAADGRFSPLPSTPTLIEVRLRLRPSNPGVQVQVFLNNLENTGGVFNVNSIPALPSEGDTGWVTTGSLTQVSAEVYGSFDMLAAGDFYAGVNNQTSTGGADTYDFTVFELILIAEFGGLVPYGQVFPRDDRRGAGSPGQVWPSPTSRQTPGRGYGYL